MSEANKNLLRRWFEQVWNQKSEAAIDEMFSPTASPMAFLTRIRSCGAGGVKTLHRTFCWSLSGSSRRRRRYCCRGRPGCRSLAGFHDASWRSPRLSLHGQEGDSRRVILFNRQGQHNRRRLEPDGPSRVPAEAPGLIHRIRRVGPSHSIVNQHPVYPLFSGSL